MSPSASDSEEIAEVVQLTPPERVSDTSLTSQFLFIAAALTGSSSSSHTEAWESLCWSHSQQNLFLTSLISSLSCRAQLTRQVRCQDSAENPH